MNAGVGEQATLKALRRVGEDNAAVRLLVDAATDMRAGADFERLDIDPVGGALLVDEPPEAVGADALTRTLALIEQAEANDRHATQQATRNLPFAKELLDLPAPVRDAGLKALQRRRRWSFGGFGIKRLPLIASGGALIELVRVEPGRGAAEHDHTAEEMTLVLTGAYNDGHARYKPGEISHAAPGFTHAPCAAPGELCYLMLVSFGPARFTGQIGLLQRLTGFPWQPKPAETL